MPRLTKRQVYDRYYGERRLSNAARVLVHLCNLCESRQSVIRLAPHSCPKCESPLYELLVEPKCNKLMTFCKECHYFLVWDHLGRVKTFATDLPGGKPINLPPAPSPLRPLERSIYKHLNAIKKDNRL